LRWDSVVLLSEGEEEDFKRNLTPKVREVKKEVQERALQAGKVIYDLDSNFFIDPKNQRFVLLDVPQVANQGLKE
jgi:hypothetical protein